MGSGHILPSSFRSILKTGTTGSGSIRFAASMPMTGLCAGTTSDLGHDGYTETAPWPDRPAAWKHDPACGDTTKPDCSCMGWSEDPAARCLSEIPSEPLCIDGGFRQRCTACPIDWTQFPVRSTGFSRRPEIGPRVDPGLRATLTRLSDCASSLRIGQTHMRVSARSELRNSLLPRPLGIQTLRVVLWPRHPPASDYARHLHQTVIVRTWGYPQARDVAATMAWSLAGAGASRASCRELLVSAETMRQATR